MKRLLLGVAFVLGVGLPAFAQSTESELRRLVPYSSLAAKVPGLTVQDYNEVIRSYAREVEQERVYSTPALPAYEAPTYRRYVPSTPKPTYRTPSSGTSYDWQSGNTYRWQKQYDGSTRVDGTNVRTGSMWSTTIKPNGSMRGTDSNFNMWDYDARSKIYMNYGTGKICTGEGYARVCSQ